MSIQRQRFETELRKPQPNWETALDDLNALAMFEMLPTLANQVPVKRSEIGKYVEKILLLQRGWRGSAQRIQWAIEVVQNRQLPNFSPSDLPPDQVLDAKTFLAATIHSPQVPVSPTPIPGTVSTVVPRPLEIGDPTWKYLLEFTAHHEYPIFHMYNNRTYEGPDIAQHQDVTCGIGHLLESPAAAKQARDMFYDKVTKAAATPEQLERDWNAAANLTRKTGRENNLPEYGNRCQLRMHPNLVYDDMAKVLKEKLRTLLTFPNCRDDFADFANFPAAAQIFSMSFAYGHIPGVPVRPRPGAPVAPDYPNMRAAIRDARWREASLECRMVGCSLPKNVGHKNLLEFAQHVKDGQLDPGTLPPMYR